MRVSDTDYTLVIVTEDGTQYDISDFAEDLGWEENEKELASHLSFTVGTDNEELTSLIKIGCVAAVLTDGVERTRGTIQRARVKVSGSKETRTVTAYDELYPLQTSEAQFLFPAGQSTKSILTQILDEWGVPLGKYTGANVTHEKLVFQNGSLAETILEILDDAEKKGGEKSILRATQGQVEIVTRGGNSVVYELDENDTVSVEHETSITSLITRVKVVGQESDKEGVPPVEAVVNGLTQFGIRQKIYRREKDATVAEARTAAQKIIDEEGKIGRNQSVTAPDAPDLRKGDRVYVSVGEMSGYFYANGVRHDATSGTMTLDLEECDGQQVSEGKQEAKKEYNTGDIVQFHGGTHYVSSYPDAKGYKASAGPAKITIKDGSGKAHPWHLVHMDKTSNVYGWVDEGTFS